MKKKCKKCEAPIGGFWGVVAGLWGVKRSTENTDLCNKCATSAPEKD